LSGAVFRKRIKPNHNAGFYIIILKEKILITGANGQLGTVLTDNLRQVFGVENVIATDLHPPTVQTGIYETLDATHWPEVCALIKKHSITQIYHMAAILSAKGEANPLKAWELNMDALFCVLEAARSMGVAKLFFPSSIAVFGVQAPKNNTPQDACCDPGTAYGISKRAGEYWAQYYFDKYGVDVRSIRYPGVISYQSLPGGGTTDYAVEIFHHALQKQSYDCYLKKDTTLPMIYIDDAIRGTLELMDAPANQLRIRTSYNLAGMSFSPEALAAEIKNHLPDFQINYTPDSRQKIADQWPQSIDDRYAREDWGWKSKFDLTDMVSVMINHLKPLNSINTQL